VPNGNEQQDDWKETTSHQRYILLQIAWIVVENFPWKWLGWGRMWLWPSVTSRSCEQSSKKRATHSWSRFPSLKTWIAVSDYCHLHTRRTTLITGRSDCQDPFRAMICPRSPPHRLSVRRNRRNASKSPGSDKSCMLKSRDMACARKSLMIGHWEVSFSHSLNFVNNAPRSPTWAHLRSHPRLQSQEWPKHAKVWRFLRFAMRMNCVWPRWVSVHARLIQAPDLTKTRA